MEFCTFSLSNEWPGYVIFFGQKTCLTLLELDNLLAHLYLNKMSYFLILNVIFIIAFIK